MIEKNVPTTAKNDCPIIVCRIVRSVSRWFSSRYRPISCRWRPNDFARRIPDTESVSSVIAVRSASVFCVLLATFRRARPTLTVSQTKIGVMQSDRIVSCTEISSIAIDELAMMTTFDSRLAAVRGHDGLHAADVVRQTRLDLARPGGREEPQRHVLQVLVERVAEVLHDLEADQVRQVRLPDADRAGDDRDDDHDPHEDQQRVHVGTGSSRACAGVGPVLGPNNALSKICLIMSGFTTPRPDEMTIATPTIVT